jgi:hypothetical protein
VLLAENGNLDEATHILRAQADAHNADATRRLAEML